MKRKLERLDRGLGDAAGKSEFVGITINRESLHWVCVVVFNPRMVSIGADGNSRPRPWMVLLDSCVAMNTPPGVVSTELAVIEWYLKVSTRT